jgi:hypothetical protein
MSHLLKRSCAMSGKVDVQWYADHTLLFFNGVGLALWDTCDESRRNLALGLLESRMLEQYNGGFEVEVHAGYDAKYKGWKRFQVGGGEDEIHKAVIRIERILAGAE